MLEEPITKCTELGFTHAWKDTTPSIYLDWQGPSDMQETCANCQLTRYHRTNTEKWMEYSITK